jgi:hypothetical protein
VFNSGEPRLERAEDAEIYPGEHVGYADVAKIPGPATYGFGISWVWP